MKQGKYKAMVAGAWLVFAVAGATVQARAQEAAAGTPVVAPADAPTDEQLAKLFEVMRVKDQMASVAKMMPQIMQQQFNEQMKQMQKEHPEMATLTPEKQKAVSDIVSRFMNRAMAAATSDDLLSDMAAIYKRHLTRSDVDGAIGFYSSPAGRHFLDMVPAMMQELMPTVMRRTQEKMKPIMEEMQKELMETLGPAPTDASKPAQK